MAATKITTCCYCGSRAALVLRGKERHELSCGSCGAPIHTLKMLPKTLPPGSLDETSRKPAKPKKTRNDHKQRSVARPKKRRKTKFFHDTVTCIMKLSYQCEELFDCGREGLRLIRSK